MERKRSRYLSIFLGLAIAAVFLFLTFRGIEPQAVLSQIRSVPLGYTFMLAGLSLSGIFFRGIRWWLLLPPPARPRDFPGSQRATVVSYGVNNVASRIGELVRIILLKKETGRDLAGIASTVVVDRIFFDFLAFVGFFAFALFAFQDKLPDLFPGLEPAFHLFLAMTLVGIAGLLTFAFKQAWFHRLAEVSRLVKAPWIGPKLIGLMENLGTGLSVLRRPRKVAAVFLLNILIWAISVAYYKVSIGAFGIDPDLKTTVLLFTVSSFGIVLPSPGGLGTVHYFISVSLIHFVAVSESEAVAAATYSHGVNYLAVSTAAVVLFFFGGRRKDTGSTAKLDQIEPMETS